MLRLLLTLGLLSSMATAQSAGQRASADHITFNHDVAPLLYLHCAPCHHAGGIGPFPLISYQDVRKHASQVVSVTASRYMPPWPPEPGSYPIKGDRHLSSGQVHLLSGWVKGGMLEGSADTPPPPIFTNEWQMGVPDLVLHMTAPFQLPADGPDLFRNFVVASHLQETRYIRGFELHLDNKRAVHHANVVLDRTQSLRHRDGEDGHPGFPGMDVITEAAPNDFDPDSHFLFWKPASVLEAEPADMSWHLDPGTDLILNLHLQPTGKPESVQADIGLYFANAAPTKKPMLLQLEHDGALHIPPGDRHFTVQDHLRLPIDVDLLAIYPHAHYLGKIIEAWAVKPDGKRVTLIRIPDWDINWQATYEYQQPVFLPKGTTLSMRIEYDNSDQNPRNPSHPPVLVEAGNRSRDEMGHVWLQVLPRSKPGGEDPRWLLQEAAMTRRLQKYPDDFLAHYNLGAFYQATGKLSQAAASYKLAAQLQPQDATVHNSLGTVLMLQNNFEGAVAQLREALAVNPGYLNARFNLARSLAALSDLPASETEYVTLLQAKPDDTDARLGVASIYLAQKRYPLAAEQLRLAAKTNPSSADLQANLGAAEAMAGNLPAAIRAFEACLVIDPNNTVARRNLAMARTQLARSR